LKELVLGTLPEELQAAAAIPVSRSAATAMPAGGQIGLALACRKAKARPSFPARM
jgi:hypothetical protein